MFVAVTPVPALGQGAQARFQSTEDCRTKSQSDNFKLKTYMKNLTSNRGVAYKKKIYSKNHSLKKDQQKVNVKTFLFLQKNIGLACHL